MNAMELAFAVLTDLGERKYFYDTNISDAVEYTSHKNNVTDETVKADALRLVSNSLKILRGEELPYEA